jgi:hypothetical protein
MNRITRNILIAVVGVIVLSSTACQRTDEPRVANPRILPRPEAFPTNRSVTHTTGQESFEISRVIATKNKIDYANFATMKMKRGDYTGAIVDYTEYLDFITMQPLDGAHAPTRARSISRAYFNRGFCYAKLGDTMRAEVDYRVAKLNMKPFLTTSAT